MRKTRYLHFKQVLPFKQARMCARSLKLSGERAWRKFAKHKSKKIMIPCRPNISPIYKKEWKNWGDFLGKENKKIRKYKVNDNFFKKWSHNMAYVFGLWFADGSIIKTKKSNTYIFNITQHQKDKYLLDNIAKIIESTYPVYKNRSCCFLQINSKTIVKDIIKLGGKYRKSLDCNFPHIPKKYLPDFIRGLFDGDGCIYWNNGSKSYRAEFSSGSRNFINKLLIVLAKNIPNFKANIDPPLQQKNNTRTYRLYCSTNRTKLLGKFMYQNNPKLKMIRKYKLFQKAGVNDKIFLPYKIAKKYIKKLNIQSENKWRIYCKCGDKPSQIPGSPETVYKNKGWVNWQNWLGYIKGNKHKL